MLLRIRSAAEFQHDVEIVGEIGQAVVAAVDYDLPAPLVSRRRCAVIEYFVSGRRQQQVTPGADSIDFERSQFRDMLRRKVVFLASMKI